MNSQKFNLKEMQADIENIEQYALKLKASGAGLPIIEKNIRIILSAVNNLRFGIVDPALSLDQ